MDFAVAPTSPAELAAAFLQLAVTLGLVALCVTLDRRYRGRYFGLWAVAWSAYALRVVSMIAFLSTGSRAWLFWHQVAAGWTAGAFLWAALVFAQRTEWKPVYSVLAFAPVAWSFIAIYVVDDFFWAAAPMIAYLSLATGAAGWAFLRYDRLVRSPAGRFLAVVLLVWAVHHLDYMAFRAQGMWNPWGYYLDIGFELAVGLGILLLVLEDLDQGLNSLTSLSGELQGGLGGGEPVAEAILRRALSLRGVHGSALWLATSDGGAFVQGAGVAALWPHEEPPTAAMRGVERVRVEGLPHVSRGDDQHAYTAALPVLSDEGVLGALVVVGEARDPFTVLDNRFLLAFGQQVGAALANEDLHGDLRERTEELERLQARMVHQHEEERSRIWRELHDETAQVLAALNLQLGVITERSDEAMAPALDRARTLLGEGIKSIRSVTRDLRPVALDDLGLVAAMRALARDFDGSGVLCVDFTGPEQLSGVSARSGLAQGSGLTRASGLAVDQESALYRSMQEALSNAVRHGARERVTVTLDLAPALATLVVLDDGPGFPEDSANRLRSRGGLAGIRERVTALGGHLSIGNGQGGGARVEVSIPVSDKTQAPDEDAR
jgi:signal transduction histidine kinase